MVNLIYSKTPEGSPTRRFLVDLYVNCADSTTPFQPLGTKTNKTFLIDVASVFASRRVVTAIEKTEHAKRLGGSTCAYHHHKAGEQCNAKK